MSKFTKMIIGILVVSFNFSNAQMQAADESLNNQITSEATLASFKSEEVRYYYFPNAQAYFDTKVAVYLYRENGEWIEAEQLAPTFRSYSIKSGHYVAIPGYTGEEPYTLFEQHKSLYPTDISGQAENSVATR